jgi:hypothetical protein
MLEYELNLFEEEFLRLCNNREYILLPDVLKISLLDENIYYKINFSHLRIYQFT